MNQITRITGSLVHLRPTTEHDQASLTAIRSTREVQFYWRADDLEPERAHDRTDKEASRLTIETHDLRIIGLIQFAETNDPEYRHASIDLYIDPAAHRRGYASDAIRTLADYLFDERGHHRLTIDPIVSNQKAIDCFSKAGFQPVGRLRQYALRSDGRWEDGLLMDSLAIERPT